MSLNTKDVYLEGPGLSSPVVVDIDFKNTVNVGQRWTAQLPYAIEFGWDPTAAWYLHAGGWTSCAQVALEPRRDTKGGAGGSVISGQDLNTFLMSAQGLSMPTLHNCMAVDVLNAIAGRATGTLTILSPGPPSPASPDQQAAMLAYINGVSSISPNSAGVPLTILGNSPLSSMRIDEFDLKGGSLGDHFTHVLRDAACNFRVGTNGAIEIFPTNYNSENLVYASSGAQWQQKNGHTVTQIWCRKQSKAKGTFGFPATQSGMNSGSLGPVGLTSSSIRASVAPGGSMDIAYVAFFTGANGAGQCCSYIAIDPAFGLGGSSYSGISALVGPIVSGIAMSCVFAVKPARALVRNPYVVLVVTGQPPSNFGYDPSFTVTYPEDELVTDPVTGIVYVAGTTVDVVSGQIMYTGSGEGDHAKRQRHEVYTSNFWPTEAWLRGHNIPQQLMWEMNKGTNTVTRPVQFSPAMNPAGMGPEDSDAPAARYDEVAFKAGSGGVSQTLTGWVTPF